MKPFAILLSMFATPALADSGEYYGHMMGGGYGYGFGMMFGPVLWLIVLGLIVAGVIWLVHRINGGTAQQAENSALAELDMRLARGEIDIDDYTARKKMLSSAS